jgi:acetyltransferase-like isoleucine patch superfamily enzyme
VARNWRKLPWHVRYRLGGRLASSGRKLLITLTHRHCRVEFQGPVRIGPGFALDIPDAGTFIVGSGVDFRRGFVCEISGDGRVTIGGGSVFTNRAFLQCTTSIEIGERCQFGQDTAVVDGFHRFRDHTRHLLDQGYDYRPVRIADGAIILARTTVSADVGRHSIVAANSVVTKPIPDFCLAGGSPARIIEYFGPPELRPLDLPLDLDGRS